MSHRWRLSRRAAALVEKDRPDWEIKFSDAGNSIISVMPGESRRRFAIRLRSAK